MKRITLAAMAALLISTSAQSQEVATNENLYVGPKGSVWSTALTTYKDGSSSQCTMGTMWTHNGNKNNTSHFYLKFNLDEGLYYQFHKTTWRLTIGNVVKTIVSLDEKTWTSVANIAKNGNIAALLVHWNVEQGTALLKDFRQASKLTIMFPNGTETPFNAKIDPKAFAAFEACANNLIDETTGAGEEEAPAQSNTTTPPKYRGA